MGSPRSCDRAAAIKASGLIPCVPCYAPVRYWSVRYWPVTKSDVNGSKGPQMRKSLATFLLPATALAACRNGPPRTSTAMREP